MIKTFVHKGLEDFFFDGTKKSIQPVHAQKLADILDTLDAAKDLADMRYPGSDLHKLKGKLQGFWAVKVSGNWRVVFSFQDGNAYDVDYLDYH
ncbi:MAG: peptidase [Deltaproteobacteria bacterium RIFOXYD12_FULL_50_9]|nr:MAG: peptidase [Deltaproteobacteria bacterium RIFOXYD12_FULL_50_9]